MLLAMMKSETVTEFFQVKAVQYCLRHRKEQKVQKYKEYNGKMVRWFNAARKYTGTKDTKVLQK